MDSHEEQVFEELLMPHLDVLYRGALRLSGDEHEVEDLVQDTFVKAHNAFAGFELREFGIRPWLIRILHNTFLSRLARRKRAPASANQQMLDELERPDERSDAVTPPVLDHEKLDSEVRAAMGRLSEEHRLIITLWATGDFTYQQIAEIIGVPVGTVMSRLHRARQQLLRELEHYARENRLLPGESAT